MIDAEHALLRCPLDPNNSRLTAAPGALRCEPCGVRYPVRDGFPIMVIEEADLPPGCATVADLPCQRRKPTRPGDAVE